MQALVTIDDLLFDYELRQAYTGSRVCFRAESRNVIDKIDSALSEMISSSHKYYMANSWSYRLFLHKARWVFIKIQFKRKFFNPYVKWPVWKAIGKLQDWVGRW